MSTQFWYDYPQEFWYDYPQESHRCRGIIDESTWRLHISATLRAELVIRLATTPRWRWRIQEFMHILVKRWYTMYVPVNLAYTTMCIGDIVAQSRIHFTPELHNYSSNHEAANMGGPVLNLTGFRIFSIPMDLQRGTFLNFFFSFGCKNRIPHCSVYSKCTTWVLQMISKVGRGDI